MDLVLAAVLGALVGLLLGALGGGGAILTVPALVYVLGEPLSKATTGSLVIVGLSSLVGMVGYLRSGDVRVRTALAFAAIGLPAAALGTLVGHQADQRWLMIGFAAVMLAAAAGVARKDTPVSVSCDTGALRGKCLARVVLAASAVGLLTGLFGVGGGFVVVPVLVLGLGFGMPVAVGTSLLVIVLNSLVAFAGRLATVQVDWTVVAPFTLAAMVAGLVGKRAATRVDPVTLKRWFAGLLVLVAGYTAVHSAMALA